jgi:hypothetical protein
MSSLAVFLVLSGATAFAATKIGANQIKANSIKTGKIVKEAVTTSKIKNSAVNGAKIRDGSVAESDLANEAVGNLKIKNGAVNLAKLAPGTLNPVCPSGTTSLGGLCFETSERPAAPYFSATETCTAAGRLLPQANQLIALAKKSPLPAQEWSGDLFNAAAGFTVKTDGTPEEKALATAFAFRCVAQPTP